MVIGSWPFEVAFGLWVTLLGFQGGSKLAILYKNHYGRDKSFETLVDEMQLDRNSIERTFKDMEIELKDLSTNEQITRVKDRLNTNLYKDVNRKTYEDFQARVDAAQSAQERIIINDEYEKRNEEYDRAAEEEDIEIEPHEPLRYEV